MKKKKLNNKEILLIIGYLIVIVVYEFVEHFGFIPTNSLLGVFLGFFCIIIITLVYLFFVQKELPSKIIYRTKIFLPYLAIPALVSFIVLAALPFFVSVKSNLFDTIVLLVVIGLVISWLVITHRLSTQKEGKGATNKKVNS